LIFPSSLEEEKSLFPESPATVIVECYYDDDYANEKQVKFNWVKQEN